MQLHNWVRIFLARCRRCLEEGMAEKQKKKKRNIDDRYQNREIPNSIPYSNNRRAALWESQMFTIWEQQPLRVFFDVFFSAFAMFFFFLTNNDYAALANNKKRTRMNFNFRTGICTTKESVECCVRRDQFIYLECDEKFFLNGKLNKRNEKK